MDVRPIAECLTNTLSPDTNTRIAAELKLSELLRIPETASALSQLILAQDAELSLRQMSLHRCVVLRRYVTERWSPLFPNFKGAAPPIEIKAQIRRAIFQGLSDPSWKIRSLCAQTMSFIASSDWPDEYPDLLSALIDLLSSNSPDAVHGAMAVFTEFIKSDMTDDQILPVLRHLLPVLLTILGSTEHNPLTRSRAVAVFNQCVAALFMVKDLHPQAVKDATASVLPVWLEALRTLLSADPLADVSGPYWDGVAIRIQIFKTLDLIHTSFPRSLLPYLEDFLALSLYHLQSLYPTFDVYYLSRSESNPGTSENNEIELPQLICPIIDFVSTVARGGKAKTWFNQDRIDALTTGLLNYAQMTAEDEDVWATNANAFVAQEEDETLPFSARGAGFDLLAGFMERYSTQTMKSLQSNVQRLIQASSDERSAGKSDWWRPLEAALAALGSESEAMIDYIEDERDSGLATTVDITFLLSNVVPSLLGLSECQFVQGRGFVFVSRYAKLLPSELAGQYLEAAVQVISANEAGIPIKVSAVKAIHNFCHGVDDSVMKLFVVRIAQYLGSFLATTSEDTLSLVLETLSVIVEVDGASWMSEDLAKSLVIAILDVWMKHIRDPVIISVLSDILGYLAKARAPGVYEAVVRQALPPLCQALEATSRDHSWVQSAAVDMLCSLAGASEGGLGDGFVGLLAPGLFACLQTTEDRDVLQNGIRCLTQIIRKDCGQLSSWTDGTGRSGLGNVLMIVGKVLQSQDESGGLVIGDLIIQMLRRAGEAVLPVLPELLQIMLSRMRTANTATFLQSLVIPFAVLVHSQRGDTILALLEQIVIENRSGLDILIQTWCENAETFQGFWSTRMSSVALCQLFASERPSLQQLMVKGDIILRPETQNVPTEFTYIPFPVKVVKLLLTELHTGGDAAAITAQGHADVDSDDGDEEWQEEGESAPNKRSDLDYLSDLLGPRGLSAFDQDDVLHDGDDPELKTDPVYQMDMQAHLVAFFRECAARNMNQFSAIVDGLTAEETLVLQRALGKGE